MTDVVEGAGRFEHYKTIGVRPAAPLRPASYGDAANDLRGFVKSARRRMAIIVEDLIFQHREGAGNQDRDCVTETYPLQTHPNT